MPGKPQSFSGLGMHELIERCENEELRMYEPFINFSYSQRSAMRTELSKHSSISEEKIVDIKSQALAEVGRLIELKSEKVSGILPNVKFHNVRLMSLFSM